MLASSVVRRDRLVQAVEEDGRRTRLYVDHEDDELVPPPPADDARLAEALPEQGRESGEGAVAFGVTELVVDRLQAIEVEIDEDHGAVAPLGELQLLLGH